MPYLFLACAISAVGAVVAPSMQCGATRRLRRDLRPRSTHAKGGGLRSPKAMAFVVAVAALAATAASANANKDIVGCWTRVQQETKPLQKGQVLPYLEYCFRRDGKILGTYLESGGHGGDLQMRWRRIGGSILELDDDRCTVRYIDDDHFLLTDCMHESEWKRACRHPRYPTTCGNTKKE